jgi:hypothetical protein
LYFTPHSASTNILLNSLPALHPRILPFHATPKSFIFSLLLFFFTRTDCTIPLFFSPVSQLVSAPVATSTAILSVMGSVAVGEWESVCEHASAELLLLQPSAVPIGATRIHNQADISLSMV